MQDYKNRRYTDPPTVGEIVHLLLGASAILAYIFGMYAVAYYVGDFLARIF